MAYRITGTYIAACDCKLLCPSPVDAPPTGGGDQCHGVAGFRIDQGNLDDTDLSGSAFALWNLFPSNITSGNWTLGIVVDEGASDDQAQAIDRIVSGKEGGPFADFAPLIGDYKGMQRGRVSVSDTALAIGGVGDVSFEKVGGLGGNEPTVSNAMFGFAPVYTVGKASGRIDTPVGSVDTSYGETSQYEYASEGAPEVHPRG